LGIVEGEGGVTGKSPNPWQRGYGRDVVGRQRKPAKRRKKEKKGSGVLIEPREKEGKDCLCEKPRRKGSAGRLERKI